jgi:hypothetical protein
MLDDRIEATLADQEICRTRRVRDTIRPSPALGQRNQTAVIPDIIEILADGDHVLLAAISKRKR